MSIEQSVEYYNIASTADLSSAAQDGTGVIHKAVNFNGTICDATPKTCAGILKSKGKTGENVRVAFEGWVKAFVGSGGATLGQAMTVAASGWLCGVLSGGYAIGRAAFAGNSGDLVPVQLDGGYMYTAT